MAAMAILMPIVLGPRTKEMGGSGGREGVDLNIPVSIGMKILNDLNRLMVTELASKYWGYDLNAGP